MKKRIVLYAVAAAFFCGACAPSLVDSAGKSISAAQLMDRIQAGVAPFILDVRTQDEYAQGHIPGTINIPHDELPSRLAELPITKSAEIVVHCHSGRRALLAEETLRSSGYTNVRDLAGHWQGWQTAELPME